MRSEIRILVEDCLTHRLYEDEALEYIKTRSGKEITRGTYYSWKSKINQEGTLQAYFNEHTRIGFVRDQRARKDEMESVMKELMRRWKQITSKESTSVNDIVKVADAINSTNKRLEEISISNPVISQIKAKLDAAKGTNENGKGRIITADSLS